MSKVHVIDHPLIVHKLSLMRDKSTGGKEFREAVEELAVLLCYEATADFPMVEIEIETPIAHTKGKLIEDSKIAMVPILRAGISMMNGALRIIPNAKVGHIGLRRNPETLMPEDYYCKLPEDIDKREAYILDPMLATGNTTAAAIQSLKERGVEKIKVVAILAAPQAIEVIQKACPDAEIYCAAVDETLDEHGYIVPGLGDAGDRIFGTM